MIEAGDRLLRAFPPDLSAYAKLALERLGVEVRLNARVTNCGPRGVELDGFAIPAATMVWGAGVAVRNVGRWLDVETDRTGKIPVGPDLSVPGRPEVFVIGDAAKAKWKDDIDVPGIAPAAKQGGAYVARVIRRLAKGKTRGRPFKYRHNGNLATIGRHSAVVDFGWIKLRGSLAWWLWGIAHVYFLIGVRSPMLVATNWFWYVSDVREGRAVDHRPYAALRVPAKE